MSKIEENFNDYDNSEKSEEVAVEQPENEASEANGDAEKEKEKEVVVEDTRSEEEKLKEELSKINDKYVRLSAEFDNYRKRSLKEKMEMIKSAGQDIFLNILPVIDNFERAMKSIEKSDNIDAVKEGITLIYENFKTFMKQRGVTEIECVNLDFDTDFHEAVTKIPVTDKKMKGKVVDVIEKGYMLSDKVLRFSKVVIGE